VSALLVGLHALRSDCAIRAEFARGSPRLRRSQLNVSADFLAFRPRVWGRVSCKRMSPWPSETTDRETRAREESNPEGNMTMNESKTTTDAATKDPICGMSVSTATALHTDRDGKTFYFCSAHCRDQFLSSPAGGKAKGKSGSCCG
jgi:YHS domain-containing protein